MERPAMLLEARMQQCSLDLDLSVERDIAVMRRRYEHEGFSFVSITLPKLADALLQGIEAGRFTCPTDFCRHGRLPRFLGGFFKRVFSMDGDLLPHPQPDCIDAIRSICDFWKKPKIACTPERNAKAEERYLGVEEELRKHTSAVKQEDKTLDTIAGILWTQVFPEIDPVDIVCKHGPGNTADRRMPNGRQRFSWWYQRSEPWFPSALHCYPNYGYAAQSAGITIFGDPKFIEYRDEWSEPPVRVVFVPKTLKTPRVIALEPSPMQFIQQGLMNYIVPRLESNKLTKHSIRFSDQTVNQDLARQASKDQTLTTLDLSDASDRVHVDLVYRIFKKSGVGDYLLAARSAQACLPSGRIVTLYKFASMGSAICFPVEAMVFYTLIQSAMHKHDGRRPSSVSIQKYSRSISVYGDDIIVPVEYTDAVVHHLEAYGLKVNVNKSFRNSLFRESCGADFYNGESVRPIYARELAPDDARSWTADQVLSWVATANQFYKAGKWYMAQVIRDMLESVLRTSIPRSRQDDGSGVCFASMIFDTNLRFSSEVHGYAQKRTVFIPLQKKDNIDGDAISCLNKWGQQQAYGEMDSDIHRPVAWDYRFGDDRCDQRRDWSSNVEDGRSVRGVSGLVSALRQNGPYVRTFYSRLPGSVAVPFATLSPLRLTWRSLGFPCVGGKGRRIVDPGNKSGGGKIPAYGFWDLLQKRSTGIDFQTSVKRGAFESKRRWVTMFS